MTNIVCNINNLASQSLVSNINCYAGYYGYPGYVGNCNSQFFNGYGQSYSGYGGNGGYGYWGLGYGWGNDYNFSIGYDNFYPTAKSDVAVNNPKVTFRFITYPANSGSFVVDSDVVAFYPNISGSFTASVYPAIYEMFVYGRNSKLKLYLNIPDTSSLVNINTCIIPKSQVPASYQQ